MNILDQLCLCDLKMQGKIETTKNFEWKNRKKTCYQTTVIIPKVICLF